MKSFLIIAIVLLFILVSSIFVDGHSYEGGPASWNVNSHCGGKKQSPIDFDSKKDSSSALPTFSIANTNNFTVANKGHTIEVRVSDLSWRSRITFDSVNYYFDQLHFHTPSEHRIDGKHFDAEAHFVFKDQNNNLSVLGVLYSVNAGGFSKLLNSIPFPYKGRTWYFGNFPDNVPPVDLNSAIYSILRTSTGYRYSGSLTTFPCNESVTWWVATDILPISVDQLIELRSHIGYNSRPTQPRNGRSVPGY